jgi:hypothetical protein
MWQTSEFNNALALLGVTSARALDRSLLHQTSADHRAPTASAMLFRVTGALREWELSQIHDQALLYRGCRVKGVRTARWSASV